MTAWVKCSERMPDRADDKSAFRTYLIKVLDRERNKTYIEFATWNGSNFMDDDFKFVPRNDAFAITYWQFIEPPEGE